jgi:hypothetical protein
VKSYVLTTVLLAISALGVRAYPAPPEQPATDESIYAEVLATNTEGGPAVLLDQTFPAGRASSLSLTSWLDGRLPELLTDTRKNFKQRNDSGNEKIAGPVARAIMTSSEEIGWTREPDGRDGFWTRFHNRFGPKATLWNVSAVGFSQDHKQALLFAEFGCGELCAAGYFFVLEQDTGTSWRIVKRVRVFEI